MSNYQSVTKKNWSKGTEEFALILYRTKGKELLMLADGTKFKDETDACRMKSGAKASQNQLINKQTAETFFPRVNYKNKAHFKQILGKSEKSPKWDTLECHRRRTLPPIIELKTIIRN